MDIKKVLQSGEVQRYHNHAGVDKQSTANHQWGVVLIVQYIDPECRKDLLLAAITHDAAEYWTGDMPAPVKWKHPELRDVLELMENRWKEEHGVLYKLTEREQLILDLADKMEGMWFCIQQMKMGHKCAQRPYRKWDEVVQKMLYGQPCDLHNAKDFLKLLQIEKDRWYECK